MESRQNLFLPNDRYPIRILNLRVKAGAEVHKDEVLGIYEYSQTVTRKRTTTVGGRQVVEDVSTQKLVTDEWRSRFAGKLERLLVNNGQRVKDPRQALAVIVEPCGHPIQVRGICATCGKDLSIGDYMGTETNRATINMVHDALGVTVSRDIAEKIDRDTSERLLKERKLILILDLDQTLVHATVDPTVKEWKADPSNPNYPFLEDVAVFNIPHYQTHYVKLRPGTREFLREMNQRYEMHIYTMGSRAYAMKIAEILDPDQNLFKHRILSRDENFSRSFKSIQRLFPSDQSMVVVVDDRSDVWQWAPNLYKIAAFNFFVGTGDINDINASPDSPDQRRASRSAAANSVDDISSGELEEEQPRSEEDIAQMQDAQHHVLEELEKSRPLERLSEATEADDEEATESMDIDTPPADKTVSNANPPSQDPEKSPKAHRRRPVLTNNDRELSRVTEVLRGVHETFYDEKDQMSVGKPDVRTIMSQKKKGVLSGVKIVFSMIFPLGADPTRQDLWIGAEHFGAKCFTELSDDVTHLVTVKREGCPSEKVGRARRMPGVFIVVPEWLHDSISRWEMQNENSYLLERVYRPSISVDTTLVSDDDASTAEPSADLHGKFGDELLEAMYKEANELDDLSDDDTDQKDEDDWDAALEAEFALLREEEEREASEKRKATEAAGWDNEDESPKSAHSSEIRSPIEPPAKKLRP